MNNAIADGSDSVREFLRAIGRKGGLAGKGKLTTKKKASKAAKARWRKARLQKAMEKLCPDPLNP